MEFLIGAGVDDRGQPKVLMMSATIAVDPGVTIGRAAQVFHHTGTEGPRLNGYDVGPDGRRFLMSKPVPPAPGEATRLLVQNWLAAMKK